jgi:CRISPR/Cas system-associated endoribonuclease Cas2
LAIFSSVVSFIVFKCFTFEGRIKQENFSQLEFRGKIIQNDDQISIISISSKKKETKELL